MRQVQAFLGLNGYFRKFIPKYSLIARPLSNLLPNNVKFHFGVAEKKCVRATKDCIERATNIRFVSSGRGN